jgi:hypothetical protein
MAAPGYPQMGGPPMGHGGPPMGGPPMGGPPMGGPPMGMQRPMRRGMSKAVPIVVSAGLAVGVFCGLLFGVGKKNEAVASSASGSAKEEAKGPPAAPAGLGASAPTPPPAQGSAAKPAAGSATVAAGSAAPTAPAAPAGSAATAPAVDDKKMTKLIVVVKTAGAAKDAKLFVDGNAVDGLTTELPVDKKTAKVEVKASGYRSYEKKLDLTPGELTLEIEMAKRSSGTPAVRPPKRPDKPPSGGGGLIDI